jgi:hypothetical protein
MDADKINKLDKQAGCYQNQKFDGTSFLSIGARKPT